MEIQFIPPKTNREYNIYIRFLEALMNGNLQELSKLLKIDWIINQINNTLYIDGTNALMITVLFERLDCTKELLKHNVNVDAYDIEFKTSLYIAIQLEILPCARLLLEYGANPNGDIGSLYSPLFVAIVKNSPECVRLLLNHDVDFHQESWYFGIPLHIIAVKHYWECFALFFLFGMGETYQYKDDDKVYTLLAHDIVRYNCPEKFAMLYIHGGGYLWYRDNTGLLANMLVENNPAKQVFVDAMSKPRSLKSWSRTIIRRNLGRSRLNQIDSLPLPRCLLSYLYFEELISEYRVIYKDKL